LTTTSNRALLQSTLEWHSADALPFEPIDFFLEKTKITAQSILSSRDLGIWLLRECLPGYEFVASARRCKTARSVVRQQQLCDGPNADSYQFCPPPSNAIHVRGDN
jgi:hypothetical protein